MNKLRRPTVKQAHARMVAHFSKPGAQLSKDDGGSCYYRYPRTRTGRACAVGCLLPDDVAKKADSLADALWDDMRDTVPEIAHWKNDKQLDSFLSRAQFAHDNSLTVGLFLRWLNEVQL